MQEILEQLKEMNENIKYDIIQDFLEPIEKEKYRLQSLQLSMAIGLLESIGKNNNI
jgi:hypothetical protein